MSANRSEVTNVSKYQAFRQVAWTGSFEGHTTLGLGVRARLPFKVFTLADPGKGSKLVGLTESGHLSAGVGSAVWKLSLLMIIWVQCLRVPPFADAST